MRNHYLIDKNLLIILTHKPTVLLVADEPKNVKYLKRKLEREGIHVIAAYSGQKCLDILNTEFLNLILLDVLMPQMDGIEVFKQIKAQNWTHNIPVIFITVISANAVIFREIGITSSDHITKPIDVNSMIKRIKSRLTLREIHS